MGYLKNKPLGKVNEKGETTNQGERLKNLEKTVSDVQAEADKLYEKADKERKKAADKKDK